MKPFKRGFFLGNQTPTTPLPLSLVSATQVQVGAADTPRALRAARQAFPFLEIITRWSWRCRTTEPPPAPPTSGTAAAKIREPGAATEGLGREGLEGEAEIGPGGRLSQGESGGREGRVRGHGDTGIASLLVALAKADPSGETIRSVQRWACEALLPEQVEI